MCIFKVFSTSSDDDRHTGVLYLLLSMDQVIFVKCLFYATPVSCLEIRLKKMFFNFYSFDLVYAEGLNKNCIKRPQKKIMSEIWKQSKKLLILI